jgi:hypothetical protein
MGWRGVRPSPIRARPVIMAATGSTAPVDTGGATSTTDAVVVSVMTWAMIVLSWKRLR